MKVGLSYDVMGQDAEEPAEGDICGWETTDGEKCQNPAYNDDGYCWINSHGDPGAENAQGPTNNMNAVRDGLDMAVKRRMDLFREIGEPLISMFEDYYVEYRGKAENDTEAAALAAGAVIRDELEANLLRDGITYPKQIADPDELAKADKDPEEAFVQAPRVQLLESYQEARQEMRLGLKYEGINDNGSGGTTGSTDASELWDPTDEPSGAEV